MSKRKPATDRQRIADIAVELDSILDRMREPEYGELENAVILVHDSAAQWCTADRKILRTWLACAVNSLREVVESLDKEHDA